MTNHLTTRNDGSDGDDDDDIDGEIVTQTIKTSTIDKNITTDTGLVTAAEQGRYIKGDPLNGYYDFVITEGSYKFWVAFQVIDGAIMIIRMKMFLFNQFYIDIKLFAGDL